MSKYQMASGSQSKVRHEPHQHAEVETELLLGEVVDVVGKVGDWCRVEKEFGGFVYSGYVESRCLSDILHQPTHMIARLSSPILSFPGLKGVAIGVITLGGLISVVEEKENHVRIQPFGWIYKRDIVSLSDKRPHFADVARLLIDVPFVWGGRSMSGVDCSGIMHIAFTIAGIDAPRRLKHMATHLGQVVSDTEPRQKGDIIFYTEHCAMFLDSETMLNCNGMVGRVRYESFEELNDRMLNVRHYEYRCTRQVVSPA